jgi:serine/threonine-protein kinase
VGKSGKEMSICLQAQGLIVRIEQETRSDLLPGQVIAMRPPEGTVVCAGEVVTLTVSRALTKKTVRVPDVVGSEAALANNALVLRGLKPDAPEYEYSASIPGGCVISQRPLSGTLVPTGSSAHLVISLGGEQEEEWMLESEE